MNNISGIYKITCSANGKFYIGSSNNIGNRFKTHVSKLKNGKHPNKHLQSAWNKYGKETFSIQMMEEVTPEQMLVREQAWIDGTKCCDQKIGFNLSEIAAPTDSKCFNRAQNYIVTDTEGNEINVTNLEKFCRENGLEKSGLHKVANGEAWQYKGWSCCKAEDSQNQWIKRRKRGQKSGPFEGSWRLTFLDGSVIEIPSLNEWAKQNKYSMGTLFLLRQGKRKKCKKIQKVEKLDSV